VSSCAAVGFGKAATGKTFPAVYIWGTVSGVTGLFRSDDEGNSWVRINDDLHQFGGPGNGQFVMGDMAVYGTVFMSTVGRGVICGVRNEDVVTTETQTILLQKGWNLISLYVEPEDNKIMQVLTVDFSIIKNLDGFSYTWNDTHLQSLTTMQAGEGYLVYLNEASLLTVEGMPLEHYTTQLHTGWNLVGVPQKTSKSVSDLPSEITQIKDLNSSDVTELEPGKAYFVNVSADTTIEW
jgi:hypothetical protein